MSGSVTVIHFCHPSETIPATQEKKASLWLLVSENGVCPGGEGGLAGAAPAVAVGILGCCLLH